MSLSNATHNLTDNARNLADNVLQSAQDAVLATRAAADQSLDQAEDTVRALRRRADPAIDDLASRAQALAARSIDYCAGCHRPVDCTCSCTRVPNHSCTRKTP